MPATLTGRGAQVVLDPLSDTAKAARGAYASTYEGNRAKVAADIAAGVVADGNRPDGTTSTGGAAIDVDVNPSTAAETTGALTAASLTILGNGAINAGGGAFVVSGFGVIVGAFVQAANDAAAASGGVPVNGLYRNGNAVQVRLT